MKTKKNILVTGSTGFIGKHLTRYLAHNGYQFISLSSDQDVRDIQTFDQIVDAKIDHVIHLAAKTYVPDSWNNPVSFMETNVLGTQQVLEFCRKNGASMTFFSSYVYGNPIALPIKEDHTVQTNNPYALTKSMAEQLCLFYHKQWNVKVVILRPFNIYGYGQDDQFLIPALIRQTLSEKEITVKDLTPKRDYIFIEDVLSAVKSTINYMDQVNGEVFNLGSGTSYSVEEIIEIVQRICNTNKEVVVEPGVRKNEIPVTVADFSKAARMLEWKPCWKIEEGIQKIIEQINT